MPLDLLQSYGWIGVENDAGVEVPAYGVLRVTGHTTAGFRKVAKPNADSQSGCIVNGSTKIPVTIGTRPGRGQALADPHVRALYDSADGTPAVDETWGPGNGTFKLKKGKTGFRITGGVDATAGTVWVVQTPGGAVAEISRPLEYWRGSGSEAWFTTPHTTFRDSNTITLSTGIIYLIPYPSMNGDTITAIGTSVINGGTAKIRLGIYKQPDSGSTWSLIVDAGELNIAGVTSKWCCKQFSSVTLAAHKMYFLAVTTDGAGSPTVSRIFYSGNIKDPFLTGYYIFGGLDPYGVITEPSASTTRGVCRMAGGFTYAALPDPLPISAITWQQYGPWIAVANATSINYP